MTLQGIYYLSLLLSEGFVRSVFALARLMLIPDYSTLCPRVVVHSVALQTRTGTAITDVVVDSTGLKVYGEGEWEVRQHGLCESRIWMRLHVTLDTFSQQVWVGALTTNGWTTPTSWRIC